MIKDILLVQKQEFERRQKEYYIDRGIVLTINNDLIKVIIGPRRAGKSFFATHLLNDAAYVNFDDERLVEISNYDEIIAALTNVYPSTKILFFDEIQNLSKWELFVNRLQRQGYNIVITGSNSKMLSKELATHLTGRHFQILIMPFSFKEYLNIEKEKRGRELTEPEIKETLHQYAVFGGYPEPLIKKIDYKEYLLTLFNSILYKDIVKRYNLRATKELEDLVTYLLSNIASEYSYHKLSKLTKISTTTIQKYLSYMEETFIFFSVNRFSYKVKQQLSTNKKIYCYDNGFIYAKAFSMSPNIGKLYENIVAYELKKKELSNQLQFFSWKNVQQEEVDFIIKEGTKITQLIQVCSDFNNEKTKEREIRALLKASKELDCNNLMIITSDYEGEEEKQWFDFHGNIKFIPLYNWLISNT